MISAKTFRESYLSLGHLYGAIYSDDAFKILKGYYPELTKSKLLADLKSRTEKNYTLGYRVFKVSDPETGRILPKQYLICGEIFTDKEIDLILDSAYGKPFYTPPLETFKKYSDRWFRENQSEFDQIVRFFLDHTKPGEQTISMPDTFYERHFKSCDSIYYSEKLEIILSNPFFGRSFQNERDVKRFFNMLMRLLNNTKCPSNRGYSPNEITRLMPKRDGPLTLTLGPNITQAMLRGEVDIDAYRQSIIESKLPPETALPLLAQLNEIERKKNGNRG